MRVIPADLCCFSTLQNSTIEVVFSGVLYVVCSTVVSKAFVSKVVAVKCLAYHNKKNKKKYLHSIRGNCPINEHFLNETKMLDYGKQNMKACSYLFNYLFIGKIIHEKYSITSILSNKELPFQCFLRLRNCVDESLPSEYFSSF